MKRIYAFVRKEFFHIFRDKRTLLILFGMPIVQILLFGFAITNEIKNANIAILDNSKDITTIEIINKIKSSGYFNIESIARNVGEIESNFKKGKIKVAIIFDQNFDFRYQNSQNPKIQILADATDPNSANTLINYLSAIIMNFNAEKNKNALMPIINTEFRMEYNPELKGVYLFVPGLITIILMLVSAMMTSISITKEKETGTMELLLVSPMQPIVVIISKVIPYTILSIINSIIILIMAFFVFGVPINGNLILLMAEIILFILSALSLGIFISSITSSQQVALMLSLVGLLLPVILLSGFIFPIENMPIWLQYFTKIIPATWFMIIIKNIMLKGVSFSYIWFETLLLGFFTVFFAAISILKFKMRLE